MWALNSMRLTEEEVTPRMCSHMEKTEQQEGSCQPVTEAPGEIKLDNVLDFQPPEIGEINLCCLSRPVCSVL